MSQEPDEGVRHYLPRLNFCLSCRLSYTNHLIMFKLVSDLVDEEIKEHMLGGEEKNLEDTVKTVEVKESDRSWFG